MNRGSGRTLAVAIASWLASAMLGCGSGEERVVASAPPVMVVPVATVDITDRIEATGQLLAKADAHVAAQVNGQVTEIVVDEGAAVEADAVIADNAWLGDWEPWAIRYRGQESGHRYYEETKDTPRALIRLTPRKITTWGGAGWHPRYDE